MASTQVKLRMAMHGVRNSKVFHIVAIHTYKRRDAKPLELLGVYNPRLVAGEKYKQLEWSVDRLKYWLSVGAQPSKSVVKLLELGGILPPDSKFHNTNVNGSRPVTRATEEKSTFSSKLLLPKETVLEEASEEGVDVLPSSSPEISHHDSSSNPATSS